MTYFEENIACKVSIEEKYFSTLGKYQILGPEYPVSCSASLGCAAALAAKSLGTLREFQKCRAQVLRS